MNCDTILERVAAGERSIDNPDAALEAHLSVCPDCRVRVARAEALGRGLRDPLMWEEPPARLSQAVADAVAGEFVHKRSRRPWWILTGAAALVAVVLGLGWFANRPDWSIDLAAGDEAPGAAATVSGWNVGGGTRMTFETTGLDQAPEGFYYEVWLTAPDGRHVSAGTFTNPRQIEVTAGVRRRDYPRIWVTLEPADDDPAPFPATVLDTALGEARPEA